MKNSLPRNDTPLQSMIAQPETRKAAPNLALRVFHLPSTVSHETAASRGNADGYSLCGEAI